MSADSQEPDGRLEAILDLAAAEPLTRTLEALLATGVVRIDGADVERVSTPCLQVLAAAALSAQRHGQGFVLRHPSAVLRAAITDLGLVQAIPVED